MYNRNYNRKSGAKDTTNQRKPPPMMKRWGFVGERIMKKRIAIFLGLWVASMLAIYLMGAFVAVDWGWFTPFEWKASTRGLTLLITFSLMGIVGALTMIPNPNHD